MGCKREESLLLDQIGEVLPENKESVLEEISLYWFQRHSDGFFGITYVDFERGIAAEGNVKVNIDYDYYLKRSESWKPKYSNNMLQRNAARNDRKKKEKIDNLDDDQYLDRKKGKNVDRFDSLMVSPLMLAPMRRLFMTLY